MSSDAKFQACLVTDAATPGNGDTGDDGNPPATHVAIEQLTLDDLPAGDVVIATLFSSINYKDALASRGQAGIVARLPHVPGIDCAGNVVSSSSPQFSHGDQVLVTGYGLGAPRWGGLSERVRVPAEWVVPLPDQLSLREAMILGTAGFTAAQSVRALLHHEIEPASGPIAVTGATGGVGTVAVAILAKLGFEVVAFTGKQEKSDWLQQLGASEVRDRRELADSIDQPMLKSEWAGAIDTVGGTPLARLVASTKYRGCVTACGLTAGADLNTTVFPFILRGVTLAGIDSAKCPMDRRVEIWQHLATDWRPDQLELLAETISLPEVPARFDKLLAGGATGRTVVAMANHG